ncbi:N-acetylneuraminate synthase family protein [Ekhidna sp.]|uniref:N-acetylneuraminate synthase family protein n=1 Tax=Ekhidna sp. TaxID=2608089 RepID=UPI003299CC2C
MSSSYFYSETAFHHEGDFDYMISLIDEVAKSNCQGIKFQILTDIHDFVSRNHSSFSELSKYCFSEEQWNELLIHTANKGLDIIGMPLNLRAVDLLVNHYPKYVEIHSVSFNDYDLFEHIKEQDFPMILGVGGRTVDEIKSLVNYFDSKVEVLMIGFQSFPSDLEKIRMGKIQILKEMFPKIEIGYADHTSFEDEMAMKSNEYARLLGATIFEKHVTLEEGSDRVDSASAISVAKFDQLIDRIRYIEEFIIPDGKSFLHTPEEVVYRNRQLKIVAKRDLKKYQVITKDDLTLKMIDVDHGFTSKSDLIDSVLLEDVEADQPILNDHLK